MWFRHLDFFFKFYEHHPNWDDKRVDIEFRCNLNWTPWRLTFQITTLFPPVLPNCLSFVVDVFEIGNLYCCFVPIWPLIARWYDWITSCFSLPVCCKGFFRVKVRSTGYLWIFNQLKASFWHGLYRVELWRGLAMLGFSSVGGHALKIWVAPLEGLALQLSHKLRCRLTWYFHLQSSISVL